MNIRIGAIETPNDRSHWRLWAECILPEQSVGIEHTMITSKESSEVWSALEKLKEEDRNISKEEFFQIINGLLKIPENPDQKTSGWIGEFDKELLQ